MSSISKSFKAGLSKSYQHLNTLGRDRISHNEFHDEDEDNDLDYQNNVLRDNDNLNNIQNDFKNTTDWLSVEEVKYKGLKKSKLKNGHSRMGRLRSAMSKVSPLRHSGSKLSVMLKDYDSEWAISPNENSENLFGKLRSPSSKMPANVPEQAALLGTLPQDSLDDVDLRHIQLSVANPRSLGEDDNFGVKQTVDTRHGPIVVSVCGDITKPVILTYHDLGLNHVTNFQALSYFPDMRNLLNSFCVVHVNAPGQEPHAPTLPEGYVYPTMDELAETISCVKSQLQLKSFIGLGAGLGANVLTRYAVKYPNEVDGLMLVNGTATVAGWIEWGYQKLNIRHLRAGNMTTGSVDYLLWHHFGKLEECNHDLVTTYRQHFEKDLNATNLGLIIDSYIRRNDLGIIREMDPNKKKDARMARCPVLNITGNHSPHVDDTVTLNGRLDPTLTTWMKIQDCGLVIDEQPGKVTEAFRLFLQGQGYAVGSSRRSSAVSIGSEGKSR